MSKRAGAHFQIARLPAGVMLLAGAALLTACAMRPPMGYPGGMGVPEMPSEEEIEEMTQAQMGKPKLQEEVQTGGIRVVFQTGHASPIDAVALSDDGRYIITTAGDETAKLWDIASGQEVRTIRGLDFGGFGRRVSFVGESHRVVLGGGIGAAARVIDSESGRDVSTFGETSLGLGQAAVSAHGRFAAFVPTDERQGWRAARISNTIAVVDLATGRTIATLKTGESTSPAAISDDGKTLIVQRVDTQKMNTRAAAKAALAGQPVMPENFVEIWDVPTQKRGRVTQYLPDGSAGPASGTLSYDGRWTANEQIDQSIKVTDTHTGELVQKLAATAKDQWAGMKPIVFSKDGRLLAAVRNNRIDIWAMPEGKLVKQIEGSAVNFSADGKTLVAGKAQGGAPFLHELATGRMTALGGGATAIGELEVIGDGRAVVAAAQTGGAKLWDLATGQLTRTFECEGGAGVYSLSASPAGPYLATGCYDGAVYLWNVNTGKRLRTFVAPKKDEYGWMAVVRFDPTGQRLAIGAREDLSLFETASGRELRRITLPRGKLLLESLPTPDVSNLSEEQRAQMAAYANDPNAISMQHAIHAMKFHPDGTRIAVAKQYSLSVWDLGSGQLVREFSAKAAKALEPPPTEQDAFMRKLMSGEPLTREDMKKLEKSQKDGTYGAMVMNNRAGMDEVLDQAGMGGAMDGANDLAFSPDGRTLLSLGFQGLKLWEVDTGRTIRPQRTTASTDPFDVMGGLDMSAIMRQAQPRESATTGGGIAVSPDGRLAARGYGRTIKIRDMASGEDIAQFVGHTSDISSVAFARGGRVIVSGAQDGSVRLWTAPQGKEIAQFIALGATDFVTVTPDQYYRISRRGIGGVAFRVGERLYPFEQFDLRFNRPDIILERLGQSSPQAVKSYRAAYDRRLKKLGFTEAMLGGQFNLPEVAILSTNVPMSTPDATLSLRVRATDAQQPLDRLNVFVNDVPVFGTAGLPSADRAARTYQQSIEVPLVPGRNKVQVSVLNQQGAESLKQTVYTTSTAVPPPRDIYLVAIGVSEYRESAYNLRFAAKDAVDLMNAYREGARGFAQGEVHVLDLTNAKATRSGIRQAREWLKQSRVNDLVVVFAAGHGMTDANQNYFFGTHDIDPERPELAGLPYEDFEALVDGIPSLQKVLLIDTCFSGEIEKDEASVVALVDTQGAGTVSMRAFKSARGVSVVADEGEAADGTQTVSPDIVRVQQELFADLRRGTGAVVISSASGNEYALEGDEWRNGVFTYALIDGLKNGRADANGDQNITIGELQAHVIEAVRTLTRGGQNPTVRRENLDYDFTVF